MAHQGQVLPDLAATSNYSVPLLHSGAVLASVLDMDMLEQVQRRATKIIIRMEHLCYDGALRD